METTSNENTDFIRRIIAEDINKGLSKVITRWPPEPNGYIHIGHAKAFSLNFLIAEEFGGKCILRMDDTNPEKEEQEFVDAIAEDIRWFGFEWEKLTFASDCYEEFYRSAHRLIDKGIAYVDDLLSEELNEYRGSPTKAGKDSPFRGRSIEENRELFTKMRNGEFPDGSKVLRAKIDMSHPNVHMRDPVLYRIKKINHHRTGDAWPIYPMYDYAHPLTDALEGITHSLCSIEFENHRPVYDWVVEHAELPARPRQYEFARFAMTYTVMSKRILRELVEKQVVSGWDDPRLPTLRGMRRRGYPPKALRRFIEEVGIAKTPSAIDVEFLHYHVREHLNPIVERRMAVINPVKVIIENYPEDKHEEFVAEKNPEEPSAGTRILPFSRELWIERDDFMEEPPRKFFRLAPGREVRLKHAYYITCRDVVRDSSGEIKTLLCTYDPDSRGGETPDGRKVKGTIHWVCANGGVESEFRLFDHLFTREDMSRLEEGKEYADYLNPESVTVTTGYAEPSLLLADADTRFQFLRLGYFCADSRDNTPEKPVFNRIVSLKDSWKKIASKGR